MRTLNYKCYNCSQGWTYGVYIKIDAIDGKRWVFKTVQILARKIADRDCDRGLENGTFFQAKVTVFHYIQTNPKLVNKESILFPSSQKEKKTHRKKKSHERYCDRTVIRDRKIWTTPRTDQVVGIITMPAWKKISELNMIN